MEQGWLSQERGDSFSFSYFWDLPSKMQVRIQEEWADFLTIDEEPWRKIRALWAVGDGDAALRLPLKMLIARYKKHGI